MYFDEEFQPKYALKGKFAGDLMQASIYIKIKLLSVSEKG